VSERATQLLNFWYPIADAAELRARPLERRVCGVPLALFRDDTGAPRVLDAACPHRGANLADGRIEGGCLSCPYHGWRFAGDGRVTAVPSQHGSKLPSRRARAFPVREQYGLLWTCIGDAATAPPPPSLAVLADRDLHAVMYQRRIPVPFDWWAENIVDVSHVPVLHRRTYGGDPHVGRFDVESHADHLGFTARVRLQQASSPWARLLHATLTRPEMDVTVEHHLPGVTWFHVELGARLRQELVFLATPEDDDHTRIWVIALRNYFKRLPGADAIAKLFVHAVVAEDLRLAARAHWRVVIDRSPASCPADAPALELVRLLRMWRDREQASVRIREAT
jgi:phenylpropionate dioxygenase-like ring-hydroxylating dioxygenase large terminal subunit